MNKTQSGCGEGKEGRELTWLSTLHVLGAKEVLRDIPEFPRVT